MPISPQLNAPAPLREVLNRGIMANMRSGFNSTLNNLRYGPQSAPSFAEQNAMANNPFAPPKGGGGAPAAPAATIPEPTNIFGGGMSRPMENAVGKLPVAAQVAGAVGQAGQMGQAFNFQTRLRDAGINLNPQGQAPGDFRAGVGAARSLFNQSFGGGAPQMPKIQAFAPTWLRERAIQAGGAPVEGIGGVQVSASPNAQGGTNFNLKQGAVSEAPVSTPPGSPVVAPAQATPFDQAVAAYDAAVNPAPKRELKEVTQGDEVFTVDLSSGQVVARAPRTALPSGYERTETGITPMKGSEDEVKQREAAEAELRTRQNKEATATTVISTIDKALDNVGVFNQATGWIPFTPGANLKSQLDTIKANLGFDQLAAMREASKTGGALGQVALKELEFLQSARGSLDRNQSPEELTKNLDAIRKSYNRVRSVLRSVRINELKAKQLESKRAKANQ